MPNDKPCVLMVDDVEANLVALDALLGSLDCELIRARGGNEALRQLLKREFAVMLLDVQMPEIDGFEVARYARENPMTRDVPIIFLTASHQTEEGVLRGYGSGAVDFLLKPFNAHVLRAKVSVFLELYQNRKRIEEEVRAHERTLEELRQTNDALRHFTNAASHDLRAPLRAVRGMLELFKEEAGATLSEQACEYMDRVHAANERMDSLLVSLLAYAGLHKKAAFTDVNCNTVLDLVKTDLAVAASHAGATIEVEKLPIVHGDSVRIYQLFLNLIGNAIKFRRPDEAPRVRVSATVEDGVPTFCVADNGIGIAEKHQAVVFDEFRRLSSKAEGTGLGLTICRKIVETHGGRLWLQSEPGRGTSFFFVLQQQPTAPGR